VKAFSAHAEVRKRPRPISSGTSEAIWFFGIPDNQPSTPGTAAINPQPFFNHPEGVSYISPVVAPKAFEATLGPHPQQNHHLRAAVDVGASLSRGTDGFFDPLCQIFFAARSGELADLLAAIKKNERRDSSYAKRRGKLPVGGSVDLDDL
jgi:hypothetical protein